ncbi:hypothetical protein PH5382_03521 [Phaeobacter sp. CECT 5382]|nr:hypothetical protein PH5382_03521 [Phaeobacter sp. CECT 5382]
MGGGQIGGGITLGDSKAALTLSCSSATHGAVRFGPVSLMQILGLFPDLSFDRSPDEHFSFSALF